jgi:DNA (cytosine-5)-methyltransferase 1
MPDVKNPFFSFEDPVPRSTSDAWCSWWQRFLRGETLPSLNERPAANVVDLFCGAGGFGLGTSLAYRAFSKRVHFDRIVDADHHALEVYKRNMSVGRAISDSVSSLVDYQVRQRRGKVRFAYRPEVISEDFNPDREPELVIGGPPCQGHSNLNNHTRRADPRNDLLFCSVAIAVALEAKAIVFENVRSIQRAEGRVLEIAKELLESENYIVDETVIRSDMLGWPQTRERLFLSAIHRDAAISALPGIETRDCQNVLWAIEDLIGLPNPHPVFDEPPKSTERTRKRIDWLFENGKYELDVSERPDCHRNGTTYTAVYGRMHEDRPAPTITTGFGTPGQGRFIHPTERRLITPHEAARIQCFPDNFRFFGPDEIPTRKGLTKWIGDAVPPILGFAAVCRVLRAIGHG